MNYFIRLVENRRRNGDRRKRREGGRSGGRGRRKGSTSLRHTRARERERDNPASSYARDSVWATTEDDLRGSGLSSHSIFRRSWRHCCDPSFLPSNPFFLSFFISFFFLFLFFLSSFLPSFLSFFLLFFFLSPNFKRNYQSSVSLSPFNLENKTSFTCGRGFSSICVGTASA